MKQLRPYQQAALDATHKQLQQWGSTVVVLPTGMGKTIYASKLISGWDRGNTLFMAHTRELIFQAAEKLGHELGYRPPVEMGISAVEVDTIFQGEMCVVASVQTMYGDKRLEKYRNHPFGLIVVDECFPAGTLVDGRPIETIRVGDEVTAFDAGTRRLVRRRVTRLFVRPAPTRLVSVTANGRRVVATENHPFLTSRGWFHAGDIEVGDDVFGLFAGVHGPCRTPENETQGRGSSALLFSSVLYDLATPDASNELRSMQSAIRTDESLLAESVLSGASGLLLHRVRSSGTRGGGLNHDGRNESPIRFRTDEGEQSNAPTRSPGASIGHDEGTRLYAEDSWWEWSRNDGSRTALGGRHGTVAAHRSARQDRRLSDALQAGFGKPFPAPCGRGGRWEPQQSQGEGSRCPQTGLLAIARVDRVEVHERGRDERFGTLCPDGRVYNLEVEGNHTYLANGFAVHNCHHATAATYRKVIDYFRELNQSLKVVGITATPNRADGAALGVVFESEAYQMSIGDSIAAGWLVPIEQEYVVCESLNYDGIKTRKNEFGEADFSGAALEEVMAEEENLHAVAKPLIEKAGDKQGLVFTAGVAHAHSLAAVLNRYKPDSAKAVDGTTDKAERKRIVDDFSQGRVQFLANCQVFTEGFDAPNCALIAMARPTKSLSLYMQMLGRGLRPLPGVADGSPTDFDRKMAILTSAKPSCYVLDFVGNSNHKLANVFDVLGGNYDVPVRELAKQEADRQKKPVGEILEQAKALLDLEREWAEREHIKAVASYSSWNVNPFGDDAAPSVQTPSKGRGGCSDAQIGLLVNLGVDYATAASYSKKRAGSVIDSIASKRCTVRQARALQKNGIDPTGIPMERASRILDALASNNWRPLGELPP